MSSLLVARTRLLYYSPKEYKNGRARAPDHVSATFFFRVRWNERERRESNERDEPTAADALNSGAMTGMQKFTEK